MNDNYSQDYGKGSVQLARRISYEKRLNLIVNLLNKFNCKKILDIGSATGDYAIDLKNNGFEVVCVDIDPNRIEILKNKDADINAIQADVSFLPFNNNIFDAIIILNAFRYFENPELALKECSRVLKAEGNLILIDHNKYCPDTLWVKQNDVREYFSMNRLKSLFDKSDFHINSFDYLFVHPPFTPKFLLKYDLSTKGLNKVIKMIYPEILIHGRKN